MKYPIGTKFMYKDGSSMCVESIRYNVYIIRIIGQTLSYTMDLPISDVDRWTLATARITYPFSVYRNAI